MLTSLKEGQDSIFGIASRHRRDGLGFETYGSQIFLYPSGPAMGPTHLPIKWVLIIYSVGRSAGAWCCVPTSSRTDVKERVELYIESPAGPSWPVTGINVHLPFKVT